jgi:hypothetical protein
MRISRSPHLLTCALTACLLAGLTGCARLNPFHRAKPAPAAGQSDTGLVGRKTTPRGLVVEIRSSPDPVKLGETRQIQVTLTVRNTTKKPISLKFPTSQIEEILLRDPQGGKVVSQWSTDRTFEQQVRYLIINPQERLEFSEPITTRELKAGKTYSLEAYFVGYEQELRVSRPIIPQP